MKKIYSFLVFLLIAKINFSQIIVTATTGTTNPTPYATLQTAFDAVNAGTHGGIVTITVNANTIETNTATLNASGNGAASYTSLSIKPDSGPAVISGSIAGPLIDLNGADNIIIDGLNNGNASLTITNTSSAASASTIRFINDATADIIQNATISGSSISLTTGTILFGTGTTAGNDNNLVANCTITDAAGNFPVNAIYSSGTTTAGQENSGNTIYNNNIANYFNADISSAGIVVATGNTDWTISTNRFYQTAARIFTIPLLVHRCIQISGGNNYTISNNIIGYASAAGTGTYTLGGAVTTRFIALDIAVGTTVASSIQNNTITNFSFATSNSSSSASGIWCAINIAAGNVNVGTTTGNTIGSSSGIGAITIKPTVAGTLTVAITSASTGNVAISNNNIGGISVLPSGVFSGNLCGIQQSATATGNMTITNNTIGNTVANNMQVGLLGTTTGNGIIRGIFIVNSSALNITNNTIQNLTHNSNNLLSFFRAIECQQGVATIAGNTIRNITANGTATSALTPEGAGILATTGAGSLVIDQNTIYNLNVTNSTPTNGPVVLGIYLGSSVNGVTITRNKIYGLTNAGTSISTTIPAIMAGIYCRDAAATNPNMLIANNMISLGNNQPTNTAIIGIWNVATSATGLTTKIYYNSVNIEGTLATGVQPSFCYYRGDFSATAFATPTIDLKNNIFTNSRNGGTGKHYAVANSYGAATSSAGGWPANASNYNVLNASAATIGYWSGDKTFAAWQAASAGDGNSLSGINIIYNNAALGDLHLTNTVDLIVDAKGTAIPAVTNDFDNDPRNVSTPDIGADEFDAGALPIIIEYFTGKKSGNINLLTWKAGCSSSLTTFDIERSEDGRNFKSFAKMTATQAQCSQPFSVSDTKPLQRLNYYRLKMTEADGSVSYSSIITILNKETGFEIISLVPTIVQQEMLTLTITSVQNIRITILVTDVAGKTVQKQSLSIAAGTGSVKINVSNLANGIYQLNCVNANEKAQSFRFIKQQ